MFDKAKARRFIFFSLGISISLAILYVLQLLFAKGE
jgi:hypothetical protein